MIDLQWIYWLVGAYLAWSALRALRDRSNPRRLANGLFWGLLALAMTPVIVTGVRMKLVSDTS